MIRTKLAAAALLLALSLNANAVPVTFDLAGEPTSYVNAGCIGFCGIDADLNPLLDSLTNTLSAGESWTFDMFSLNLFGVGLGGVEAFLGFDQPIGAPGAEGTGGGVFISGSITAGVLVWTQQPGSFTLVDGTRYSVWFDNLLGATRDQDIIVQATLKLWDEPTSVPEPGVLALLGVGLLGLGFAGRRRKAASN